MREIPSYKTLKIISSKINKKGGSMKYQIQKIKNLFLSLSSSSKSRIEIMK